MADTDKETGWTKEFPQVEGFYFARRTQTNAPSLTVIQVWQYENEWFAYRFAHSEDIESRDFVRSLYEYFGPVSLEDFEQLIQLRKAAQALADAAELSLSTPGLIRGRDQLANAREALCVTLAQRKGEQS